MSSGMYSALSGNLAKMKTLDIITNNLTNATTFGFKKERLIFESVLNDAKQNTSAKGINFTRARNNYVDFSQGASQPTGRNLDFSINGEGFFKVQDDDGNIFYTRSGNFVLDGDSTLKTTTDLTVLNSGNSPITLPNADVDVDEEGRIFDGDSQVDQLAIYTVEDTSLLKKKEHGMFSLPDDINDQEVDQPRVQQGHLEASNVNMMQEMALMMDSLRTFESYQKIIKSYGAIGSKLDELGSLG